MPTPPPCPTTRSYVQGATVPWQRLGEEHAAGGPGGERAAALPPQLAVPYVEVALRLGMPPVMTAAARPCSLMSRARSSGHSQR